MTQLFNEDGTASPVTVIEAGPCPVLQVRTIDRDGYEAVQLGFLDKKRPGDGQSRTRTSQASRSERGHVTSKLNSKRSKKRAASGVELPAKAECEPKKFIREIRGAAGDREVGQLVSVEAFAEIAAVDVSGISKGRGFSGVMRRHNFAGQRATHGVKKVHRHAGGTGMSAYPSRTFRGKRMPGQYGNTSSTQRNLKVIKVDAENNLLVVRGAIPGPNGGYVVVRETNKF
ncbi:50S ribosomal protein L3 [Lignipirellula cremea]|nr:50S ribosomal protein L3 [Lignipirellula cremea]